MSKSALKILQTAENLFNEQGFVGVGVDIIRDKSGCSKTTMYTYYQNKTQLIKSVLLHRDKKFQNSLIEYIGKDHDLAAIEKILEWHQQWFLKEDFRGCLFVRAVSELRHHDEDVIQISKQHKMQIKQLILSNCQNFKDPILIGELIYTLIEGLIAIYSIEPEIDQDDLNKRFNIIKQHIRNFI